MKKKRGKNSLNQQVVDNSTPSVFPIKNESNLAPTVLLLELFASVLWFIAPFLKNQQQ
jgi:hypothetical protein